MFIFLHALFWWSGPGAGIIDVVPVRFNDNYRGLLWFCGPFHRSASNFASCSENAPNHDFITTVVFPTNHKVLSLWRTSGRTSWLAHRCLPICLFLSFMSLYISLSVSHSVYIQRLRLRGELSFAHYTIQTPDFTGYPVHTQVYKY